MSNAKTSEELSAQFISALAGGWTAYGPLNEEAKQVFDKALQGLLGVNYEPLVVASQVVSGTNYSFFCNAQVVAPNTPNQGAMVAIYVDLNGNASIKSITLTSR